MGDSGKDTNLEIFCMCLDSREPENLCTVLPSVTANTDYVKRQRGIHHLTESSSQACSENSGDVNIGRGLDCLTGKTEVDPVLKSFISARRLNRCYAAAQTLHGPFVPPWLLTGPQTALGV